MRIPIPLFVAILFAPFALALYIQAQLYRYRRSRQDWFLVFGWRGLRPDRYTEEGQPWLRRLWLLLVLVVPWAVVVMAVFKPV